MFKVLNTVLHLKKLLYSVLNIVNSFIIVKYIRKYIEI